MYMTPTTIRKRFFSVLETAEKNIHLFVNTPGSDMTRHRLCPYRYGESYALPHHE